MTRGTRNIKKSRASQRLNDRRFEGSKARWNTPCAPPSFVSFGRSNHELQPILSDYCSDHPSSFVCRLTDARHNIHCMRIGLSTSTALHPPSLLYCNVLKLQRSGAGEGVNHWMLKASRPEKSRADANLSRQGLENTFDLTDLATINSDWFATIRKNPGSSRFASRSTQFLPPYIGERGRRPGKLIDRGQQKSVAALPRSSGEIKGRPTAVPEGMSRAHHRRSRGGAAAAATQSSTTFEIPPSSIGEASAAATAQSYAASPSSTTISPQQSRVSSQTLRGPTSTSQFMSIAAQDRQVNLDLSPEHAVARKELLREAYFPDWKDDASSGDLAHPDEMQKNDPLATQIWKLYSKTKTQLPNQERMENLTWRMMAMSLKRKEREQAR